MPFFNEFHGMSTGKSLIGSEKSQNFLSWVSLFRYFCTIPFISYIIINSSPRHFCHQQQITDISCLAASGPNSWASLRHRPSSQWRALAGGKVINPSLSLKRRKEQINSAGRVGKVLEVFVALLKVNLFNSYLYI